MTSAPTVVVTTSTVTTTPTIKLSSGVPNAQVRPTHVISFHGCQHGIGIKVIGGKISDDPEQGVFIKRLLNNGLALNDGRLRVGDQILRVNGQNFDGATYGEVLSCLREAASSGLVTLVVTRDERASAEFQRLMEEEMTSVSESSRADTPVSAASEEHKVHQYSGPSRPLRQSTPPASEHFVMNNSAVQSESSVYGKDRPDIQRLDNAISEQRKGHIRLASTPNTYTDHGHPAHPLGAGYVPQQFTAEMTDLPTRSPGFMSPPRTHLPWNGIDDLSRKDPINPHNRMKADKLESALTFLGLQPTEQQKAMLRADIHADANGTVSYGEFIAAARKIFQLELEHYDILSEFERFKPSANAEPRPHASSLYRTLATSIQSEAPPVVQEMEQAEDVQLLEKENANLRKQLHSVTRQLNEQVFVSAAREKDLIVLRKDLQQAAEEAAVLQEKLLMAVEAQKMAEKVEKDFESIIQGLEKELLELREREAMQHESPAVRQKLAVLGTQLRKAEESSQTYQTATRILLNFAQHISDVMSGATSAAKRSPMEEELHINKRLAADAVDIMKAIRTLIEREPLPFGWEQCFGEDGTKYYINHVTQETSWQHPVSRQVGGRQNKRSH